MHAASAPTAPPPASNARTFVLVGVGGAIGSVVRHGALSTSVDPSVMVFALNVVGSLALGGLTAWLQHDHVEAPRILPARGEWEQLFGLGVCGGLTTFSTHMVDVAQRLESSPGGAAGSVVATAATAVLAALTGFWLTRSAHTR